MNDRVTRVVTIAVFALCCFASGAPARACPIARGSSIVLVSQELDPDVFLWDSADRLVRYAAGDYDVEAVLKHTVLIRAFSHAQLVGCRKQIIRASAAGGAGGAPFIYVVGVRIVSGIERGRYGWVMSADIRGPGGRQLTALGQ